MMLTSNHVSTFPEKQRRPNDPNENYYIKWLPRTPIVPFHISLNDFKNFETSVWHEAQTPEKTRLPWRYAVYQDKSALPVLKVQDSPKDEPKPEIVQTRTTKLRFQLMLQAKEEAERQQEEKRGRTSTHKPHIIQKQQSLRKTHSPLYPISTPYIQINDNFEEKGETVIHTTHSSELRKQMALKLKQRQEMEKWKEEKYIPRKLPDETMKNQIHRQEFPTQLPDTSPTHRESVTSSKYSPTREETSPFQRVSPTRQETSPFQRVSPTRQETSPFQRVSPTRQETSPFQRVSPTRQETSPFQRVSPTRQETSPFQRVSPTMQDTSPFQRVSPTIQETSPFQTVSPTRQATSPFQILSPKRQETSPFQRVSPTIQETSPFQIVPPTRQETSPFQIVSPTRQDTSPFQRVSPTRQEAPPFQRVSPTRQETSPFQRVSPTRSKSTQSPSSQDMSLIRPRSLPIKKHRAASTQLKVAPPARTAVAPVRSHSVPGKYYDLSPSYPRKRPSSAYAQRFGPFVRMGSMTYVPPNPQFLQYKTPEVQIHHTRTSSLRQQFIQREKLEEKKEDGGRSPRSVSLSGGEELTHKPKISREVPHRPAPQIHHTRTSARRLFMAAEITKKAISPWPKREKTEGQKTEGGKVTEDGEVSPELSPSIIGFRYVHFLADLTEPPKASALSFASLSRKYSDAHRKYRLQYRYKSLPSSFKPEDYFIKNKDLPPSVQKMRTLLKRKADDLKEKERKALCQKRIQLLQNVLKFRGKLHSILKRKRLLTDQAADENATAYSLLKLQGISESRLKILFHSKNGRLVPVSQKGRQTKMQPKSKTSGKELSRKKTEKLRKIHEKTAKTSNKSEKSDKSDKTPKIKFQKTGSSNTGKKKVISSKISRQRLVTFSFSNYSHNNMWFAISKAIKLRKLKGWE